MLGYLVLSLPIRSHTFSCFLTPLFLPRLSFICESPCSKRWEKRLFMPDSFSALPRLCTRSQVSLLFSTVTLCRVIGCSFLSSILTGLLFVSTLYLLIPDLDTHM